MKLPTYQFLAQMAAAFAVVVSLGFVAYELKLARDVARAEVYQQRIAMDQAYRMYMLDSEAVLEAEKKVDRGEELSELEITLRVTAADIAMMNAENVFYQYQLGLLDEEEWAVWQSNMTWMLKTPCYREYFERNRNGFRKVFASEIDGLYLKIEESDCPSENPD